MVDVVGRTVAGGACFTAIGDGGGSERFKVTFINGIEGDPVRHSLAGAALGATDLPD